MRGGGLHISLLEGLRIPRCGLSSVLGGLQPPIIGLYPAPDQLLKVSAK